jgi:hypothetical protein
MITAEKTTEESLSPKIKLPPAESSNNINQLETIISNLNQE